MNTGKVVPLLQTAEKQHLLAIYHSISLEPLIAFASAIDWNERWIQLLLAFELTLLIIVVVYRNNFELQACTFFFLCILISFSERINAICANNWGLFSTQNYFDVHGAFAVTFFSGPLLFIGFIQLVISFSPKNIINARSSTFLYIWTLILVFVFLSTFIDYYIYLLSLHRYLATNQVHFASSLFLSDFLHPRLHEYYFCTYICPNPLCLRLHLNSYFITP